MLFDGSLDTNASFYLGKKQPLPDNAISFWGILTNCIHYCCTDIHVIVKIPELPDEVPQCYSVYEICKENRIQYIEYDHNLITSRFPSSSP